MGQTNPALHFCRLRVSFTNPNMYLAETVGVRKTHPQPTIKCKHKTYYLISPNIIIKREL